MSKEILSQTPVNSFPLRTDGDILSLPKRTPYDTLYENKRPPWWRRIFRMGWRYEKEANFQIRNSWKVTLKADEAISDKIFKPRVDEDGRLLTNPTTDQIGNNN